MQSAPAITPQPLDYSPPHLRHARIDRVDIAALVFAAGQILVALVLLLPQIVNSAQGYSELKDPRCFQRAAWWMTGGAWTEVAILAASVIVLFGAIRVPGRRRPWYAGYVTVWLLVLATLLLGTAIVDREIEMRERWVPTFSGAPGPGDWKSIPVGWENYAGTIGIMLAFNHALILLTLRGLRVTRPEAPAATTNDPTTP